MIRGIFIKLTFSVALLLTLSIGGGAAQQSDSRELRLTSLYYNVNQTYPNPEHREKLDELVILMAADTTIRLTIISHTDRSGTADLNRHIAQLRAQNVVDYMSNRLFSGGKIERSRFSPITNMQDDGVESDDKARRVDIYREVKCNNSCDIEAVIDSLMERMISADSAEIEETTEEIVTEMEIPTKRPAETTTKAASRVSINPEPQSDKSSYKPLSIRTNLLYLCGGLINGGVEWRPRRGDFGYLVNGGYSPFANQDWEHNMGGYFISPEVRLYMGARQRGYIGLQALLSGYNFKMSETGYQGDMYGAGLVGGYRTKISKSLELDFTLAAGYSMFEYGSYKIIYNGMSLYTDYGVEKRAWIPLQVGVSLIWGRSKR